MNSNCALGVPRSAANFLTNSIADSVVLQFGADEFVGAEEVELEIAGFAGTAEGAGEGFADLCPIEPRTEQRDALADRLKHNAGMAACIIAQVAIPVHLDARLVLQPQRAKIVRKGQS
jgi:hypothetical protein